MSEDTDTQADVESAAEKHRKFHNRVGALFLGCAGVVGLWMTVGPAQAPLVLLLVQLPLFVILAFIGIKALLKAAKGIPSRKR